MDIGKTDGVGGAGRIDGPQRIGKIMPAAAKAISAASDKLDISNHAKITSATLALPSVRAERIQEVRDLLKSGRFDTEARLNQALDRFVAENRDALDE